MLSNTIDIKKTGMDWTPCHTKGIDYMSISNIEYKSQRPSLKDLAIAYAKAGIKVFPLKPRGKTPLTTNGFKAATTDLDQVAAWWTEHPTANIGFPTGETFDVLDFDLNLSGSKGAERFPEVWETHKGVAAGCPIVRTANGYHVYFRPTGIGNKANIGPEVGSTPSGKAKRACDWRGKGGYVLAPGSVWEDGTGCYELVGGSLDRIAHEPPEEVMEWIGKRKQPELSMSKPVAGTESVGNAQKSGYLSKVAQGLVDDMKNAVEGERNHTLFRVYARMQELLNGSLGTLPEAQGLSDMVYEAALSAGLDDSEINQTMRSARNSVGGKAVEPEFRIEPMRRTYDDSVGNIVVGVEHQPLDVELYRYPPKKVELEGAIMQVAANVKIILMHDDRWAGKIVYNEFSKSVEKLGHVPSESAPRKWNPIWNDMDDTELADWLSREYGMHFKGLDVMRQGVFAAALMRNYHPVRKYLTGLKWDGVERLSSVPYRIFGVSDAEYAGKVFRWWMISGVYRIMEPGCKADYAIILEGAQGIGKSTILSVLGGEWFMDSPIDMTSKDAYSQTIGTWIVEIPELSGFSRTDDTRAKSFFSERAPRVRLPFRRDAEKIPRECIFAGTTNENDYLKDSTGNRRYWPIKCGETGPINLAELERMRDQLWAEAYEMWRRKERYYPTTSEENDILTAQQSKRMLDDAWSIPVLDWIREKGVTEISPADVFEFALDKKIGTVTSADSRRLAAILKKLGYETFRPRVDGKQVTKYRLASSAQMPTLEDVDM